MKTVGWVLLVFGSLSCIGALTAGHSIFGPLFFIAIGLMLINKSNNSKKNENNNTFLFQSTLATPDSSSEEVSNEFPDVEETNF